MTDAGRCSDAQHQLPCQIPPGQDASRVEAGYRRLVSSAAEGSDEMTDELITRLAAANPVPHDGPLQVATPTRLRPSRRLVLGGTVAMAALAVAGIAVADGLGPFSGISSVQHPQTTGDLVDPATEAYLERTGCTQPTGQPCAPMISGLQFDAARRLAQLPDGQNVYVIPRTGTNADPDVNLCTIVGPPDATTECRSTVTQSHPSTMLAYLAINHSDSSATRWFIFGVAIDGATSVSFDLGEEATQHRPGRGSPFRSTTTPGSTRDPQAIYMRRPSRRLSLFISRTARPSPCPPQDQTAPLAELNLGPHGPRTGRASSH